MLRNCKANVVALTGAVCYNEGTEIKGGFSVNLPEKIVKLRKAQGWSQEELAEKLNVSRQAISRWKTELRCPMHKMSCRSASCSVLQRIIC
ncbi:MAG: helix-turn-helix transcriptional regulator [Ruminococcaceae bacterium]|nr:helix-turn-helix transcriptional regulator [Oscillospiraceae bacterium]